MLPPETTATMLAVAARRACAATARRRSAHARGAFGDDVTALGGELHRAAPRRRARRRSTRRPTARASGHIDGEHGLAAGAVDERAAPVLEAHRRVRPRATPTAARRSPARRRRRCASGRSARITQPMPASRPPPPIGAIDGVDVRQVLENLERRRAVAADEIVVVERMDEAAVHAIGLMRLDGAPAFVEARP